MNFHRIWPIKPRVGHLRWAIAATMIMALVLPGAASAQTASRVGGWFLFGANMPWLNWNADFGGGAAGGVSGNIAEVDAKLQAAQTVGMHMVRWWVFEGGSPQIQRDGTGTPTGINPNVYTDLDAALTEAARFDISYNFVLFGSTSDDAITHQWWEDSTKRQALVRVLTPLFQRYASNPRVHTWELVNEPEWQSRNGITSVAGMLATGDALANAIHQNSSALVTVGNAQIQDMQTWVGHPLDYHSPHYYDNFGTGSNDPFVTAASSPDGKPVVIGEFQAYSGLTPTAQARWQALYAGGYAGGWNWSLSPEHTGDHFATDLNAAAAFSGGKTDLGPRTGGTVGAKGFGITPQTSSIGLSWTGGSAQAGYLLGRLPAFSSAVVLPAAATSYTDNSPAASFNCYIVWPVNGASVALGQSDFLCGLREVISPTGAPGNWTMRLNQTTTASFSWTAPGGQDGYILVVLPTTGPTRTVALGAGATTTTDNTAGVPTCYLLIATRAGAQMGQTGFVCGFPGIAAFSAVGAPVASVRMTTPDVSGLRTILRQTINRGRPLHGAP